MTLESSLFVKFPNPLPLGLEPREETTDIIWHCTGGDWEGQSVAYYDGLHTKNGWAMFGYHLYIDKKGKIHAGRPLHVKGSHCVPNRMNHVSIGVCLEGKNEFTFDQLSMMPWVNQYLKGQYGAHLKVGTHRFHDPKRRTCPHWTREQIRVKIGIDPFDYDLEGYVNPDNKEQ